MAQYLDYERLQRFWGKVKGIITGVQNNVSNLSTRVENLENNGGGGGSAQSFNDVTLIGVGLQTMFVRAPKGLLKDTDKPVFARYRKSKIRGSDDGNYWVGDDTHHVTVKGWIVPLTHPMPNKEDGGVHEWAEDMSLQKISPNDNDLGCSSWDDKYDFFQVLCDGEDFISWMSWARYNENITGRDNNNPLKLGAQKLGIRIDRDGKTIVDYLPFSTQELDGDLVYGRWR